MGKSTKSPYIGESFFCVVMAFEKCYNEVVNKKTNRRIEMLDAKVSKILIDTYPEAAQEDLPMFAENRVHQRTSGNPYPNKVVLEAQRDVRGPREYTLITLENEYIELGILPELGGKIWYANDKKNGYGFFYKNNVVKPALIGVLCSWTSGGL